jgi:hypothetical protein
VDEQFQTEHVFFVPYYTRGTGTSQRCLDCGLTSTCPAAGYGRYVPEPAARMMPLEQLLALTNPGLAPPDERPEQAPGWAGGPEEGEITASAVRVALARLCEAYPYRPGALDLLCRFTEWRSLDAAGRRGLLAAVDTLAGPPRAPADPCAQFLAAMATEFRRAPDGSGAAILTTGAVLMSGILVPALHTAEGGCLLVAGALVAGYMVLRRGNRKATKRWLRNNLVPEAASRGVPLPDVLERLARMQSENCPSELRALARARPLLVEVLKEEGLESPAGLEAAG